MNERRVNTVHVFGDSHSRFFFDNQEFVWDRLGWLSNPLKIRGKAISAASVMGFRPQASKLKTKEIINNDISAIEYLCLAFGQVDLELGLYFRKVVKQEYDWTAEEFTDYLTEVYMAFLEQIQISPKQVSVKGANLTVLKSRDFLLRYVSAIISKDKDDRQTILERLAEVLLDEKDQNVMIEMFNSKLKKAVLEYGASYFDINENISTFNESGARVVDLVHCPAAFDHHLADTLYIRKIHRTALISSIHAPHI